MVSQIIKLLILLLPKLIDLVESFVKKRKREKRQRKRDEAAGDPGAAFDKHFDGLSRDRKS